MVKECQGQCVKCGSYNIAYGTAEFVGEELFYECSCEDCGAEFREWYALKYIETESKEQSN